MREVLYQVMNWSGIPVGTGKHAVIVWKPVNKTANKSRKLAGRNGHKPTKTRVNLTHVDLCHVVKEVTELHIGQLRPKLQTIIIAINSSLKTYR